MTVLIILTAIFLILLWDVIQSRRRNGSHDEDLRRVATEIRRRCECGDG